MLTMTEPSGCSAGRRASIHATVHAGYSASATPPYWSARWVPYGGEVTTADTDAAGSVHNSLVVTV